MSVTPEQPPEKKLRDPEGNEVTIGGRTVAEQQAGIAEVRALWARRGNRETWKDTARADIDAVPGGAWEFIDLYTPFPVPGSQEGSGSQWPEGALSLGLLAQRIAILRVEAARNAVRSIRIARVLQVLLAMLEADIVSDDAVTPPPDR